MADRLGCLGQWWLTECRLGSIGRIGSRRHARRRRGITQKEGREKRRRTKKTKRTIDRCQLPSKNSISKYILHHFIFQKFLSCSFDDFSANLDPNLVIFDFVDLSSSFLSKNIKTPNLYLHVIIQFDQISKDHSKLH